MTRHLEPTRLLIAVSGVLRQSFILAADGEDAHAEIGHMSCNPEDWYSLSESMPNEPGLYVWEGNVIVEDGQGMGEYGGLGDADFTWEGECRRAELVDLLSFNFHTSAPVCPFHRTARERDERGDLYCRECKAEAGRASGAARRARRGEPNDPLHVASFVTDVVRGNYPPPGDGRDGRDRAARLLELRRDRKVLTNLPDEHSIQCPDCWLVLSRTDLTADGNVCRGCGHRFIVMPVLTKGGES